MKKLTAILLCIILGCSVFTGCSNSTLDIYSNDKLNIVCTIYPQYDWVMQLLGNHADNYNVTLLVDNGSDLHSYQPSAKDIITISTCDMFIYVGGESDAWVESVVEESGNEDMITINMTDVLGDSALEEEIVEGMQNNHAHHSHDEELEYDEHIWLSLGNAKHICNQIVSALCQLDSAHSDSYNAALNSYTKQLDTLDLAFSHMVSAAKRNTILFADRFPFRYLVEDYDIKYYAAFAGCSAETEASFKTIAFLVDKVNALELPAVCVTESSNQSIADTIIDNTKSQNQEILILNSMQSVTSEDIKNGISYISIMESNRKVLQTALN